MCRYRSLHVSRPGASACLGKGDEVKGELLRLTWDQVHAWRRDDVTNLPAAAVLWKRAPCRTNGLSP